MKTSSLRPTCEENSALDKLNGQELKNGSSSWEGHSWPLKMVVTVLPVPVSQQTQQHVS